MHRYIKSTAIVLFSVTSALSLAGGFDYAKEDLSGYDLQPNLRVTSDSEYARTGNSFYFYGGYLYTYRFLDNKPILIAPLGISYSPSAVFPSNFDGFEFGIGKELSRHVEVQLAYLQNLTEKKNNFYGGNAFQVSSRVNAVLGDVGFVVNPDDQFQVVGRVGAMVREFYNTVSINGFSLTAGSANQTYIEPAAGMDLIWKFSNHVAFQVGAMYVADTHSTFSSGEINGLAALSYTL